MKLITKMLDVINMIGNHEERNVDRFENELFIVDTSMCNDMEFPYETAISHRDFNDGSWIILGWSKTKEEAQTFHNEVVHYFSTKHYIKSVTDIFQNKTYYRN